MLCALPAPLPASLPTAAGGAAPAPSNSPQGWSALQAKGGTGPGQGGSVSKLLLCVGSNLPRSCRAAAAPPAHLSTNGSGARPSQGPAAPPLTPPRPGSACGASAAAASPAGAASRALPRMV
jgi:hypothetical protein